MTASDQIARPPDAPPPGPEWKPVPGARDYESSHRGKVRSLDRTKNGRFYKGVELKLREDGDGYLMFNYTDDEGVRHHNVSVARITLLTWDPDGYREGLHACHGPGGQKDNRWPENIRWDTPDANREEALAVRLANSPPKPKPLKVCVRCGAGFSSKGQRCRPCIVWFAEEGARRMAGGMDPEQAAQEVGYPSAIGLIRLGMKHAGLRFVVEPPHVGLSMTTGEGKSAAARLLIVHDEVNAAMVTHRNNRGWLRRVMSRREASRRDSDTQ